MSFRIPTYNEMTLRTTFAVNPLNALNHITEAAMYDEDVVNQSLLNIVQHNGFVELIGSIVVNTDASDELRDYAAWALSMLFTTSNKSLSSTADFTCISIQNRLIDMLVGNTWHDAGYAASHGKRSVAYLLFNWVSNFTPTVDFSEQIMSIVCDDAQFDMLPENCLSDFYSSLARVFDQYNKIDSNTVSAFLRRGVERHVWRGRAKIAQQYFNALSNLCERDDIIKHNQYVNAFKVFDRLYSHVPRRELFWALSNLLCEPGAADVFSNVGFVMRKHLYKTARISARNSTTTKSGLQAIWALGNWAVHSSDLTRVLDEGALTEVMEAHAHLDVASYVLAKLSEWDVSDLNSFDRNDVMFINSVDNDADPVPQHSSSPLPSAIDLIIGNKVQHVSNTLRNLVSELKKRGVNSWVPVPADALFTAADLSWMARSGYTILNGNFGVNFTNSGAVIYNPYM
jgi:hypothetical protein